MDVRERCERGGYQPSVMLRALVALALAAPLGPLPTKPLPGALPKPKAMPKPTGVAKKPKKAPTCTGSVMVPLATNVNVPTTLAHGDRATGQAAVLLVKASVRWTKRRLHVEGDVAIQERHGFDDGDTRYRGVFRDIVAPAIPAGCEIAKVTPASGALVSEPKGAAEFTVTQTGLITSARCQTDHGRRRHQDRARGCWDVDLAQVEVKLRPAQAECKKHLAVYFSSVIPVSDIEAGDRELGGDRPTFNLASSIEQSGDKVTLRTELDISESGGNNSRLSGSETIEVFDAALDAPGCGVTHVSPKLGALSGRPDANEQNDGVHYPGPNQHNLIKSAWCRTNSGGDDLALTGCGEVTYQNIWITLAPK